VPSVEPIDNRRRCRAEDPIPDLSRLTIDLPMQGVVPKGLLRAVCQDDHPIARKSLPRDHNLDMFSMAGFD
jgi:hypothetical protein